MPPLAPLAPLDPLAPLALPLVTVNVIGMLYGAGRLPGVPVAPFDLIAPVAPEIPGLMVTVPV